MFAFKKCLLHEIINIKKNNYFIYLLKQIILLFILLIKNNVSLFLQKPHIKFLNIYLFMYIICKINLELYK